MKTRTPVSSVILYIFGIIFMIVAVFMLWTAIEYTKVYLASYDTTFEEMWSNSVQYVIEKFLPYFSAGVICIGLGKAISIFRKGLGARQIVGTPSDGVRQDAGKSVMSADQDEISMRLRELREVGSIKLEELERREKVRLDDMRETVVRDMALHRLQREAKEEEIISKLNAMGEKLGLDMMDLYDKADIPVVPDYDEQELEEKDMIGDDPLFEELDRVEPPVREQKEQTEAPREEAVDTEGQIETVVDEPTGEPEDEAAAENVDEPVDGEPVDEASEDEAAGDETSDDEASEDETTEEAPEKEQDEEVSEEQRGNNQVLTHDDEPGDPEQIETDSGEAMESEEGSEAKEEVSEEASEESPEESQEETPDEEVKEESEGESAEDVKEEASAGEDKPNKSQKPSNKKSKKQKKHKKKKKK